MTPPRRSVTARAYGKVNLFLYAARPDARGYHGLTTLFHSLNQHETVTLHPDTRLTIHTTAPAGVVQPEVLAAIDAAADTHLAVRAVRAVAARVGCEATCRIEVAKTIPVAGGMAGGSADAAAALVGANEFFQAGLDRGELAELGRGLGADVPFCLAGGNGLGTGYGDHIRPLEAGPVRHWVLAINETGLSTPAVFKHFDSRGRGRETLPELSPYQRAALTDPDPRAVAAICHNDLEYSALEMRPELRAIIAGAREAGAVTAFVSGSGPTIAALAQSHAHAVDIAGLLARVETVAQTLVVTGPGRAAHLVEGE